MALRFGPADMAPPAPLSNPFDAGCDGELVDMSAFGIVVGVVLLICSWIAFIPSLTKPIKMQSTVGVSPVCLILTNLQQTLLMANTLVLKWPQIAKCGDDFLGCQPTMIQVYTTAVSFFMLFPQHLLTVCYPNPPEAKCRNRVWWYGQLIVCGGILIASVWWSVVSDCATDNALRNYGVWCGLISSVLMVVRFIPQVIMSCVTRSSGGISLITYGFIGIGGFAFTYFSIVQSHEEVTTWLPTFVGNCFQTLILCMCIFYDYIMPKKQASSTTVSEQEANLSTSFLMVRSATGRGIEKVKSWSRDSHSHRSARPSTTSRMSRLGSGPMLRPVLTETDTESGQVFDATGGYIVPPAAVLDEYIGDVMRSWAARSSTARPSLARGFTDGSSPGRPSMGRQSRFSWWTSPTSSHGTNGRLSMGKESDLVVDEDKDNSHRTEPWSPTSESHKGTSHRAEPLAPTREGNEGC